MAKRGRSHKERAIRKGGAKRWTEIAIVNGELLSHIVIERQFVLVIEVHRLVVCWAFYAVIELLGGVVLPDESIAERIVQGVVRELEVCLVVRSQPAVVQIGHNTATGIVERNDRMAIIINIGVEAGQLAGMVLDTGKAVHAAVVIFTAAAVIAIAVTITVWRVIWAARSVSQRTKIVVE